MIEWTVERISDAEWRVTGALNERMYSLVAEGEHLISIAKEQITRVLKQ